MLDKSMPSEVVRIDDGRVLLCPNCGRDYLHHDIVTVHDRQREDDETIDVTTIDGRTVIQAAVHETIARSPSSRRHGLAIRFWCEGCDHVPELTVAQHKGQTYLAWRNIGIALRR
jgi:hypothetical protein